MAKYFGKYGLISAMRQHPATCIPLKERRLMLRVSPSPRPESLG